MVVDPLDIGKRYSIVYLYSKQKGYDDRRHHANRQHRTSLAMFAEVDQGIYEAEPRTLETTPQTTFRRRCEEVLRPTVGGSS
jgi:hypothetical protein